ncbi:hypothetical protein [Vibrio cholerae]|uniref:hypothetical protein n=1 Tax=Vibrio cholerae TaxID=666 RepID=UPI000E0B7C66|nr:hypothetical protein [Vibrio cholerae]EJF7232746.1 hypothetical protein [Vibrio cholerae]EJL6962614.1 hypothetical protein [Vibrio cholerae]EKF9238930.1 hypothetical protein [Vibrio cholerae]
MPIAIPALAALALEVGPSVIRGISSLFGGNDTASKVADAVEAVDGALGMNKAQKQIALTRELQSFPPEALVDLERIKVEMEREITRRQELALQDKQAEHHETQETIRNGDNAQDEYVRHTRPKQARQSFWAGTLYIFGMTAAKVFNLSDDGPDLYVALTLYALSWAYHGLRTLDGFAPYSKSSGDKVSGVIGSVIKGRK